MFLFEALILVMYSKYQLTFYGSRRSLWYLAVISSLSLYFFVSITIGNFSFPFQDNNYNKLTPGHAVLRRSTSPTPLITTVFLNVLSWPHNFYQIFRCTTLLIGCKRHGMSSYSKIIKLFK